MSDIEHRAESVKTRDTAERPFPRPIGMPVQPWKQVAFLAALYAVLFFISFRDLFGGVLGALGLLIPVGLCLLARDPRAISTQGWIVLYVISICGHFCVLVDVDAVAVTPLIVHIVASAYFGMFVPAFVGLTRTAVHRFRSPLWLIAPMLWGGLEWLRGRLFGGSEIASLTHAFAYLPSLCGLSQYGGSLVVNAIIVMFSASLAEVLWNARQMARVQVLARELADESRLGSLGTPLNMVNHDPQDQARRLRERGIKRSASRSWQERIGLPLLVMLALVAILVNGVFYHGDDPLLKVFEEQPVTIANLIRAPLALENAGETTVRKAQRVDLGIAVPSSLQVGVQKRRDAYSDRILDASHVLVAGESISEGQRVYAAEMFTESGAASHVETERVQNPWQRVLSWRWMHRPRVDPLRIPRRVDPRDHTRELHDPVVLAPVMGAASTLESDLRSVAASNPFLDSLNLVCVALPDASADWIPCSSSLTRRMAIVGAVGGRVTVVLREADGGLQIINGGGHCISHIGPDFAQVHLGQITDPRRLRLEHVDRWIGPIWFVFCAVVGSLELYRRIKGSSRDLHKNQTGN